MVPFTKFSSFILTSFLIFFFSSDVHAQKQTVDSSKTIMEKVEVEASFPGGPQAWVKYISNAIKDNIDKLRRSDYGTCIVRFIVDTEGHVSEVKAMTMKRSRLAKLCVDAIINGPKWNPAQQNGKFVNAYRLQPVTLESPDK